MSLQLNVEDKFVVGGKATRTCFFPDPQMSSQSGIKKFCRKAKRMRVVQHRGKRMPQIPFCDVIVSWLDIPKGGGEFIYINTRMMTFYFILNKFEII